MCCSTPSFLWQCQWQPLFFGFALYLRVKSVPVDLCTYCSYMCTSVDFELANPRRVFIVKLEIFCGFSRTGNVNEEVMRI